MIFSHQALVLKEVCKRSFGESYILQKLTIFLYSPLTTLCYILFCVIMLLTAALLLSILSNVRSVTSCFQNKSSVDEDEDDIITAVLLFTILTTFSPNNRVSVN